MPGIKITTTQNERDQLTKIFDSLWMGGPKTNKKELFHNGFTFITKMIQEAYEIGKEVGETDLD